MDSRLQLTLIDMRLAGCQISRIYVNFHLQKSLEIFDKNSADKVQSKKDKGIKVPSVMPIRVKALEYWVSNLNALMQNTVLLSFYGHQNLPVK